ncbi:MAG: hypothetical protein PHR00_02560 [Patescibacteria group bacterium]|nr:hypothetical protein [Patescibacteria group bacterium]
MKKLTDGNGNNPLVKKDRTLPQERVIEEAEWRVVEEEATLNGRTQAKLNAPKKIKSEPKPDSTPKAIVVARPVLPEPFFGPEVKADSDEELLKKWADQQHPTPEYKPEKKEKVPPPEKQYLPRFINKTLIALLAVFTAIFFISIIFLYNAFQDKQAVPAKNLTGDELLDKAIMEYYNRGYSINSKAIIKSGEKYQGVIEGNAKSVFLTNNPVNYSDKNGFGKIDFDKVLDINMIEQQKHQVVSTPHNFQIAADQETKFVWMIYDNSQRELFSNVNTWLGFFENTIANFSANIAYCLIILLMIGSFVGAIISTIMLIVQSAKPKKLIYTQA